MELYKLTEITTQFTQLPNAILTSSQLNLNEKTVYTYLLSRLTKTIKNKVVIDSSNWIFYKTEIAKSLHCNERTISKILQQMEQKGFIKISQNNTPSFTGYKNGFNCVLYYEPFKPSKKTLPDDNLNRIKLAYRQMCTAHNITKKTIKYPDSKKWNSLFNHFQKYKYLIPFIPCYFEDVIKKNEPDNHLTFEWFFNGAFNDQAELIDCLLMYYEYYTIQNKKNIPDNLKDLLIEMTKDEYKTSYEDRLIDYL